MSTKKSKVVQKADPTLGDASEAAAQSGGSELNTRYISYATPGGDAAGGERHKAFSLDTEGKSFLELPEDPGEMYKTYHVSAYLGPIMDALQTNVYKAPYKLKPIIPFDRPVEANRMVREALMWEKAKTAEGTVDFDTKIVVTDKEVEDKIEALKQRAVLEKHFLNRFFEEAVPDMTYRQLGCLTGQDQEITGNAYWEIIRDTNGNIARFQWLPSISMRATPQDLNQIATTKPVRDGFAWSKTQQIRRYRRYVQLYAAGTSNGGLGVSAWFKEFGDPRVMSRTTGKYYLNIEALQEAETTDNGQIPLPATEVLHFKILFGGSSVYGKPRWSGMYIGLRGSRELDEENLKIVSDEAIPSLLLLISGGIMGQKAYDRLENQIKERKKGRKGLMIIEANAAGKGPVTPQQQPSIDVQKLKSEQNTDMLFQKYDLRNEDKADGAWRLPKTVLGKAGANRATSQSERQFAEDQVFNTLRNDKDEPINNQVLADLNIAMWIYETQSMQPRDPQQRAEILKTLVDAGILTPNEGRELASPIFSERLNDLQGLWTQLPPRVLTVLLQTKNAELAATLLGRDKGALDKLANAMRDTLGLGKKGTVVPDDEGVIDDDQSTEDGEAT
jgi:capsid portal protein